MARMWHTHDGGEKHEHATWSDLIKCIGGTESTISVESFSPAPYPGAIRGVPTTTPAPISAASGPASPVSAPPAKAFTRRLPPPTGPQLKFIFDLGGSWRDAYLGSRKEASELIDLLRNDSMAPMFKPPTDKPLDDPDWEAFPQELAWLRNELGFEWSSFDADTGQLNGDKATGRSSGYSSGDIYDDPDDTPDVVAAKSRLETMMPLLDRVPEGYYAAAPIDDPDSDQITFMRLSRPKTGKYKGSVKVQTLHGDRLELAWVRSAWGGISIYNYTIEDYILMLMADHKGPARLFAEKRNRCARCGTGLTDPRSRKLGIGPECEKHWPDYVHEIMMELEERGERL